MFLVVGEKPVSNGGYLKADTISSASWGEGEMKPS
jgi:hypothetical protein